MPMHCSSPVFAAVLFVTFTQHLGRGKAAGVHCCSCWCRAVGIAKDTYLETVPDIYPAAAHKEALRLALRQLWASARGPATAEAAALVIKVGPPWAGGCYTACPLAHCWAAPSASLSEQAAGHIAGAYHVLLHQAWAGSLIAAASCVWNAYAACNMHSLASYLMITLWPALDWSRHTQSCMGRFCSSRG